MMAFLLRFKDFPRFTKKFFLRTCYLFDDTLILVFQNRTAFNVFSVSCESLVKMDYLIMNFQGRLVTYIGHQNAFDNDSRSFSLNNSLQLIQFCFDSCFFSFDGKFSGVLSNLAKKQHFDVFVFAPWSNNYLLNNVK